MLLLTYLLTNILTSHVSRSLMVSVGVSALGTTSIHFIELGVLKLTVNTIGKTYWCKNLGRNGSAHYWCSNQTVAHTSSYMH